VQRKKLLYIAFLVLFFWTNQSYFAQSLSNLEKRAIEAFEKQNYSNALVDYRQLLAKDQQNPDYNYRYGVCIFEVENRFKAAKYFDVVLGLRQIPDPLLYYYRAQIYQEQYFFKQAIQAYQTYAQLSQNAKFQKDISKHIAECNRGLEEVEAFIRLPLISLSATENQKFYSQYPFSSDDYSYYEAPEVHSKNNAKNGHVPVYAYKRGMKYRIFSSYGPKGTQLDLYIQQKDANNEWGQAALILGEVNNPLTDESFGFYDPNTSTLYFSSKSKSIGQHDLFKAKYSIATNTASEVEKMAYPYSSPSDDLFYVCDATQQKAYFATNRQGKVGQYEIYVLELDAAVQANFIFSGFFNNELEPNSKSVVLEFSDLITGMRYGPFVSDDNGAYQVALPLSGDFALEIQVEGASKSYQTRFNIPNLKPQTALQQQVSYFSDELGAEQWQVRNQIVDLDPANQIAGLSQLQFQEAKGSLLTYKSSINTIQSNSSLPSSPSLGFEWGMGTIDTTAFIAKMTDSLIAAEVSLENQVRLMELLRHDFELQLAFREQMLAQLSELNEQPNAHDQRRQLMESLTQVERTLAFDKQWIEINQAANIPDLEILDTLRSINERNQLILLTGDSLELINGWQKRRESIQQYLQIAAFDGASALEAASLDEQRNLQNLLKEESLVRSQKENIALQIKQLQADLPLQSKKVQSQTQLQIEVFQTQLRDLEELSSTLHTAREAKVVQIQVFEQTTQKEAFLVEAENQELPELNLQSSYEALLAQYAQQEVLSAAIKSQNEIILATEAQAAERSEPQPVQEVALANEAPAAERSEPQPVQEVVVANETPAAERSEPQPVQEVALANEAPAAERSELQPVQEVALANEAPAAERSEPQPVQEVVVANEAPAAERSEPQPVQDVALANEAPAAERSEPQPVQEVALANETPAAERSELALNMKIIEEQISIFEDELLALAEMSLDELPIELPKINHLFLSNEALIRLDEQLELPKEDKSRVEQMTLSSVQEMEAYLAYLELRNSHEQLKIDLLANQQEIRDLELYYSPDQKQELTSKLLLQQELQTKLLDQKALVLAQPNQAKFEALMIQNYRPPLNSPNEVNSSSIVNSTYSNEFRIEENPNRSSTSAIPVGLPCPEGLVFRVQVGAFRKPVPADRFREFTPVDGQILANGLTVYMAGYFKSSKEALQQQTLIRKLGYSDAFVVAYQNCNRLSLAQGRLLESNITPLAQELEEKSQFASPGQGLYYSVQVGVYNRLLSSEGQLGLPELIEAKTAKGQYRYASGKFDNVISAKERQQLAVNKGVKDAFIVAYYQGKRITLAEAKTISQSGIVFETTFESKPHQLELPQSLRQEITALQFPKATPLQLPDPICRYEIKCNDCLSELSRYNRVGVFIYDPEKDLIFSALQKSSQWNVVQQMYLKELRKRTLTLKGETQTVVIVDHRIDGAFMDWLLRQQHGYELLYNQDGDLELRIQIPEAD
jgi:hypothetical protein